MPVLDEGSWDPKRNVSREEVRHMQSRVLQFKATHSIPEEDFEDAPKCPESWCRWVVTGSLAYGRRQGPAAPLRQRRPRLQSSALPSLPVQQVQQEDDSDLAAELLLTALGED